MYGYENYVALGDSFTEGLSDALPDGTFRGWADRLAEILAAGRPGFRYANLALRGKMLAPIIAEQVPAALELKPDLVTFCGGGNDVIVPGTDVDEISRQIDEVVATLRASGIEVVLFNGPDPKRLAVLNVLRGKIGIYNANLWAIAHRHGAKVVDLWAMEVLRDRRAWSEDRLHFTAEGHRRIALRTAECLGVPTTEDWRVPWPEDDPADWIALRRSDLYWTRTHLLPWIRRHLRGQSMGDGLAPKRPHLTPLLPLPSPPADDRATTR
ncbi:MAG TPA: SGNH/GDSL hydrolase family protein [Amycolatopsis sp.]|nr:SGNH/GDSL hydrolase family protein [Amycolatopsis sp.]